MAHTVAVTTMPGGGGHASGGAVRTHDDLLRAGRVGDANGYPGQRGHSDHLDRERHDDRLCHAPSRCEPGVGAAGGGLRGDSRRHSTGEVDRFRFPRRALQRIRGRRSLPATEADGTASRGAAPRPGCLRLPDPLRAVCPGGNSDAGCVVAPPRQRRTLGAPVDRLVARGRIWHVHRIAARLVGSPFDNEAHFAWLAGEDVLESRGRDACGRGQQSHLRATSVCIDHPAAFDGGCAHRHPGNRALQCNDDRRGSDRVARAAAGLPATSRHCGRRHAIGRPVAARMHQRRWSATSGVHERAAPPPAPANVARR